ncbi:MAG: hypothetical protein U0841_15910 [Chloroflexia bacterium]
MAAAPVVVLLLLSGCALGQTEATAVAVLVEPTLTPTVAPTAVPTLAPTPRPSATATPLPPAPTATTRLRTVDFRDWQTGESDPPGRYRRAYDAATGEYAVEIMEEEQEWSFYSPDPTQRQDFRIDVEGRRAGGPDGTGYGLVFRRQAPQAGQLTSERYIFYVTDQGAFGFTYVNGDNVSTRIKDFIPVPGVIRVGEATNKLTVICNGSSVRLLVNDQEVYQANDLQLVKPGDVGIFAGSAPNSGQSTKVIFKGFAATTP